MWKKKNHCQNFEEYVFEETGCSSGQIVASGDVTYCCPGIPDVASMLIKAVSSKQFVGIITDYDCDGIGSAAEIFMILKKLGADMRRVKIIIPKRFSDGYGINKRMADTFEENSFVMTIDNGIAANEAIRSAKDRNMTVVVMDHHLRNGDLPPADLIIDPEDNHDGWTFHGYCGAGLVYKLAEELFPDDEEFLDSLSAFCAISTVADIVNVTGDNRNIILRGLKNINQGNCEEGLKAVIDVLRQRGKVERFGVYELGFKIGPMFNAPGRLIDDGGQQVVSGLFRKGQKATDFANSLFDTNEKRKKLVDDALKSVSPVGTNICFVYIGGFEEGLCGILAGKLCEQTHLPTFVMTDSKEHDGIVKGSARGREGGDVFSLMQAVSEYFTAFGGHAMAAGFSLKAENILPLCEALESVAPSPKEYAETYNFEVNESQLSKLYEELMRVEIFGEGLKNPVIKVRGKIVEARPIGANKTTLSFKTGNGIKCIGFSLVDKYKDLDSPTEADLYGTLETNWWKGKSSMQFNVIDIEK